MKLLPPSVDIFITADGSPTLQFKRDDGYGEKMHHSGGALSESLFVYQSALQRVLENNSTPRVLSMGLGLGYNEIITCAHLRSQNTLSSATKIWSFEALPFLRDEFTAWLGGAFTAHLHTVYEDVLQRICAHFQIHAAELKNIMLNLKSLNQLQLRSAFPDDLHAVSECNLVYYDAYSKKMDAELWDEEILVQRLGACLSVNCVLATYAATGSLNRALKRLGFRLIPKPGFLGKRESTLAIRGQFS